MKRLLLLGFSVLLAASGRGDRAEMESRLGRLPPGKTQTATARLPRDGTRLEIMLR